jgi:hypothetical protein
MDIRDYYIKKKSEIQIAKDEIMENIMKQQGMYDMYFLGEIGTVEMLINYIDKDICIALLTGLVESEETSDTIKKLAKDLIEKYSKEPKFEL